MSCEKQTSYKDRKQETAQEVLCFSVMTEALLSY